MEHIWYLIKSFFYAVKNFRKFNQVMYLYETLERDLVHKMNRINELTLEKVAAEEKSLAKDAVNRGLLEANQDLANHVKHLQAAQSRQANEIQRVQVALNASDQILRAERDGFAAVDDTNRALEARLKTIFTEFFPQGTGMYLVKFDQISKTVRSFKMPLGIQRRITSLLNEKQQAALKKG